MATPSNLWGASLLGGGQARRMSRRFARVGVRIPPDRLRETYAGAAVTPDEVIAIQFALMATQTCRELRHDRVRRLKRNGMRALIMAAMVLITLNALACAVYLFVSLALHDTPW